MTGFFIALIAVLSLVGSVIWVRPSKRDVKLAKWRQEARVAGLFVKLDGLAAEPKDSGIRDDVAGASYYLYSMNAPKEDNLTWAAVKAHGWLQDGLPSSWSWYQRQPNINAVELSRLIESAPVPILALERTPKYSRVIWAESGQVFDGPALKLFLERTQSLL